ncbi:MAG: histidine kinase dimerization/phospho-acceptor domain-containing protein [Chryseolinea sp.]
MYTCICHQSTASRSNEELGQYAYVASHDLQEPLRKIRTFSDRLNTIGNLPLESKKWLDKIYHSSERRAFLIRNLLEFSRLIKSDDLVALTGLNEVLNNVLSDFELTD